MNTGTSEVESPGHFAPTPDYLSPKLVVIYPQPRRRIQSYASTVYRKNVTRHHCHDPIRFGGGWRRETVGGVWTCCELRFRLCASQLCVFSNTPSGKASRVNSPIALKSLRKNVSFWKFRRV